MVRVSTLVISALSVLFLFLGSETGALADQGVARAQFTSNVIDREPVDDVVELANDARQIYLYTELEGLAGTQVIHRWEWSGQVMAEVPFAVNGNRWRVWSKKSLDPLWLGEWKASIVDAEGKVLAEQMFTYTGLGMGLAAEPIAGEAAPMDESTPAVEVVPAKREVEVE